MAGGIFYSNESRRGGKHKFLGEGGKTTTIMLCWDHALLWVAFSRSRDLVNQHPELFAMTYHLFAFLGGSHR